MTTLPLDGVDLVYDVTGPLPPSDDRPPLLMIGQPMDAAGFRDLAEHFVERTVVTYDPRGLGRSVRTDGRVDHDPVTQAGDVHALITALDAGPVDLFASSGGAVTALALVAAHPDDVVTLVAHEPPLMTLLPDADLALRARVAMQDAYASRGFGAGMASFVAMMSWPGEFTGEFLEQLPADPAAFGMPDTDDGSREDPILSGRSWAVLDFRPDVSALLAAPTRVVVGVGAESADTFTARTSTALAILLGREAVVFPSHHGGFVGGDGPYAGQPEAFAVQLREILDEGRG